MNILRSDYAFPEESVIMHHRPPPPTVAPAVAPIVAPVVPPVMAPMAHQMVMPPMVYAAPQTVHGIVPTMSKFRFTIRVALILSMCILLIYSVVFVYNNYVLHGSQKRKDLHHLVAHNLRTVRSFAKGHVCYNLSVPSMTRPDPHHLPTASPSRPHSGSA